MTERRAVAADWRLHTRRWSAPRIAAAVVLHLLMLIALVLGTSRTQLPRPGADRSTTLVTVTLTPSIPAMPLPLPLPKARAHDMRVEPPRSTADRAHARHEAERPSLPLPLPAAPATIAPATAAVAANPPASAPSAPLRDILNTAATRQAIRDVARGTRLSELGNAATHEEQGSTMTYEDGHECPTCTRNLAAPTARGERLAQAVKSAGRPDCLKQAAGAGIWALPVLIATETARQCSN